MPKTEQTIKKYLGYKFYKINEDDSIEKIRLIRIGQFHDKVTILNLETNKIKDIHFDMLKEYTPLEPKGIMVFNRVGIHTLQDHEEVMEDVVVTIYRLIDIKMDMNEPYAICRQSVNDFFYNTIATNPDHGIVGVCANRDNTPMEMMATLTMCDEIYESTMVNFYLDDVLDDILQCVDVRNYDFTLNKLFNEHLKFKYKVNFKTEVDNDDGWCKNLRALLRENNVITDLDTMRNIIAIDVNLMDYMNTENDEVYSFNKEMSTFFAYTYKLNLNKTMVIKFDYDINLGDFNNSNYCLMRDNTNTLYLVVYTLEGEYLESDLESQYNDMGIADKIRLAFYNKYAELTED